MKNKTGNNFFKDREHFDLTFSKLDSAAIVVENKVFDHCEFIHCNFTDAVFSKCKFVDCKFKVCNLSAVQFPDSSFIDTQFIESKVIGVNWTKLRWPNIRLHSPFGFYKSNISHSSFYHLQLQDLIMEECIAHDVDFRESDLSGASFVLTDFENSQFMRTQLCAADFTDATNYYLDPNENNIRKAKFSFPDVINLLHSFDIEIQQFP